MWSVSSMHKKIRNVYFFVWKSLKLSFTFFSIKNYDYESQVVLRCRRRVSISLLVISIQISDGPEYTMFIHAEIEKPLYHFSCMEYNFGKCFINAPDSTYKKNIAFVNDDKVSVMFVSIFIINSRFLFKLYGDYSFSVMFNSSLDLNFTNAPELFVDYNEVPSIHPGKRLKVPIYFKPKQVREYEFKLQFWVNSLREEIITIKGEGLLASLSIKLSDIPKEHRLSFIM